VSSSDVVGMLSCPRCAAPVADTSKTCAHCTAPLLLKSCGRCLSRVFHGHAHCPACGSGLGASAAGDAQADRPCPRCTTAMHPRPIGDLVIDECDACHGVFLDHVAIQRIVTDRQQARAEAVLATVPRAEVYLTPPGARMYIKCPVCSTIMNRKQFSAGSGVVIDVCKSHGAFFDPGELPAIITFVMNGGLEQSQKKELERMREAVKREQQNAQFSAMMAARSSTHAHAHSSSASRGEALRDLLFALWR
jgi:Zn-finger nucleic acid-binding protein